MIPFFPQKNVAQRHAMPQMTVILLFCAVSGLCQCSRDDCHGIYLGSVASAGQIVDRRI